MDREVLRHLEDDAFNPPDVRKIECVNNATRMAAVARTRGENTHFTPLIQNHCRIQTRALIYTCALFQSRYYREVLRVLTQYNV